MVARLVSVSSPSRLSSSTPVFVQVHTRWRQMYVGVCEGGGVRTDFDMVQLRYTPQPFSHLAGLLEQFKSKVVMKNNCTPSPPPPTLRTYMCIHPPTLL